MLEVTKRARPERAISRLLLMSYSPSGFWSRLMTRVLADDAVLDAVRGFFVLPSDVNKNMINLYQ